MHHTVPYLLRSVPSSRVAHCLITVTVSILTISHPLTHPLHTRCRPEPSGQGKPSTGTRCQHSRRHILPAFPPSRIPFRPPPLTNHRPYALSASAGTIRTLGAARRHSAVETRHLARATGSDSSPIAREWFFVSTSSSQRLRQQASRHAPSLCRMRIRPAWHC